MLRPVGKSVRKVTALATQPPPRGKPPATPGQTFEQALQTILANLKPRLAALISAKVITQKQADKVLDRIAKGHIPFWNGTHHHKKK